MHTSKSIAQALVSALRHGADPKYLAHKLKEILQGTPRESELPRIISYLQKLSKKEMETSTCRIESATELTAQEVTEIQKIFGIKEVQTKVSPDLVSGFRVQYGDILYDGSLSARLNKLREAIG